MPADVRTLLHAVLALSAAFYVCIMTTGLLVPMLWRAADERLARPEFFLVYARSRRFEDAQATAQVSWLVTAAVDALVSAAAVAVLLIAAPPSLPAGDADAGDEDDGLTSPVLLLLSVFKAFLIVVGCGYYGWVGAVRGLLFARRKRAELEAGPGKWPTMGVLREQAAKASFGHAD
jgi:hypothetical protein